MRVVIGLPLPGKLPDKFRPIYKITIKNPQDSREYEFNSWYYTIDGVKLRSLNKLTIYVDRDLSVPLDMFRIRISTRSGNLRNADQGILKAGDIKIGAVVKIYLGYDTGSEESTKLWRKHLVLTGLVDDVSQDFSNIVITGYSNAYKIAANNPEALKPDDWKNKDSQSIVKKLLDNMVTPDSNSYFHKGMTFKSYIPDVKKSIYENIKQLADYNGFDLYFSKEGKLRFYRNQTGRGEDLVYAENILDNSITMTKPPYDAIVVKVTHETSQADDDNVWQVSSEPLSGASSAGKNKEEELSSIFKHESQAVQAAKNMMEAIDKPETGQVKTLGNPDLELGQSINIKFANSLGPSAPGAKELDYMSRKGVRVTRITHKFNMRSGFVTIVGWTGPPSSKTGFKHLKS